MNNTQVLVALASKLMEISENCVDVDTQSELNELVDKIMESV
jgi:hypothetical protein